MSEPGTGSNFTWRQLVVVLLVVLVFAAVLLPVLFRHVRDYAREINCAGDLKTIGLATLMYTGDNHGFFPIANAPGSTNFEPLNTSSLLADGRVYACPSASVAYTMAYRSNYRYRGSGLKDDNEWATSVTFAYDVSGNHPGNGWMNAVFIDGHVEGARPDGSKSTIIPAIPPGTLAIVIGPWNLND